MREGRAGRRALFLFVCVTFFYCGGLVLAEEQDGGNGLNGPSSHGGAGYALVFNDNVVVKNNFRNFPSDRFTFEAWISTSDFCHTGAVLSYALDSKKSNMHNKTQDYNHFVIFDPRNILACHDFEFIDMVPDLVHMSCHSQYRKSEAEVNPKTANFVERDGTWHHLAVTWSTDNYGETIIYMDGMVVGRAITHKTDPLKPDGALMLGGEQDCYGGCTDPRQGFYGMMDEVRIWNVVRSQEEILSHMRLTGGTLDNQKGLVAYWKFDDPGTQEFVDNGVVRDSSGNGNDLDLFTPPRREDVVIQLEGMGDKLKTGALKFKNNYAMNSNIQDMPTKDITVEFWARSGNISTADGAASSEHYAEFFSFATQSKGDGILDNDYGQAESAFMDDAIRIERYLSEFNGTSYLKDARVRTMGAISVHINANRQGNGKHEDNWIDFATEWVDDYWHHVAVTWEFSSGRVQLYFDGKEFTPFWKAVEGSAVDKDPSKGGITEPYLGPRVERSNVGSLVLGQNQECYGGCFSPSTAYDGYMAELKIWDRVLTGDEIRSGMFKKSPDNQGSLAMMYKFDKDGVDFGKNERQIVVKDKIGQSNLNLGSISPSFQYSDAPLTNSVGTPLPGPKPGYMGHALKLHDRQVLILHDFKDFPSTQITVEFWMWSIDTCRRGVPFSYAHGDYEDLDNAFLIFDYNSWGVAVMENEGTSDDHAAGFGSTDGRWHHIAVTWDSKSGATVLYDNGRPQWTVVRSKGEKIPSGGTLVIGREQDCLGGCFDSAEGAAGDIQTNSEYGPQDFFGIMEEMRIWKRVRTPDEIYRGMLFDRDAGVGMQNNDISSNDPSLVAWWKFDEGQGYSVSDHTGRGHTLQLLEKPNWVVPKWLESCGDGILEGTEQCDDGNRRDGDGCSSSCTIEEGWTCDAMSCRNTGGSATGQINMNGVGNLGRGHSKKSGSSAGTAFLVILVIVIIALIMFITYRKREVIYEYVPAVEDFVHASKSRMNRAFGTGRDYNTLSSLDPQVTDISPEFVDSQPPASYHPPGRPVPYEPIPDARRV